MKTEGKVAIPRFPVVSISGKRGIVSYKDMDSLSSATLNLGSRYFQSLKVIDSNSVEWSVPSAELEERLNFVRKEFERIFPTRRFRFALSWSADGTASVEKVKSILKRAFDEDNDFYAERGITTDKISRVSDVREAIRLFSDGVVGEADDA